ncbi:DUF6471 domain-containing protein [Saccharophagus degradans]|uniref:DUF6471 domain-containing protein n=1 Tax=Saccharophagus degradans TaxID=86304 RepID=A0AAW7X1U6_9GAMM|nr:DUF6471 domain-containing protein [Saccharophagus degradans]MDO6421299.1 DUF6471 domain-containing protein [Saccharophagus degradans]MDO6605790.1 DUF6471 domain-containing protein [Saccharophagus degradans]WGO96607.1 DUF6471 domain-containing protein [Saccharophagus degradans]
MANIYQNESMRKTLARYIRAQMELAGVTYNGLSVKLEEKFGIIHNPATLRNKVNSGALGAQMFLFMVLCLEVDTLQMRELEKIYLKIKEAENNGAEMKEAEKLPPVD